MARLLAGARRRRRADPLRRRRGPRRPARPPGQRHRPRHPASRPTRSSRRLESGEDQGGPDRDRSRHGHRGQRRPAVRDHHPAPRRSTDGRRATVAFTDDWKEDAARRDFTINALSADPDDAARSSTISAASTTCEQRHVRFIGDPLQRIAEDHLRILRFFRFHARFGVGRARRGGARRLHRARQRPDGPVARADRRRTAETAGCRDPAADRRDHASSAASSSRCCPRSRPSGCATSQALIAAERRAGIDADALRRLAPCCRATRQSPTMSPRASGFRTRRGSASRAPRVRRISSSAARRSPIALGTDCAVDRLLLAASRRSRQPSPTGKHRGCRSAAAR